MSWLSRIIGQDVAATAIAASVGALITCILTLGLLGGWDMFWLYGVYGSTQILPTEASLWILLAFWILLGALSGWLIARFRRRGWLIIVAIPVGLAVVYSLPLLGRLIPFPVIGAALCLVPISGLTLALTWASRSMVARWDLGRSIAIIAPLALAVLIAVSLTWLIDLGFSSVLLTEEAAARAANSIARDRDLEVFRIEVDTEYDNLAKVHLGENVPNVFDVKVLLTNGETLACRFQLGQIPAIDDCG